MCRWWWLNAFRANMLLSSGLTGVTLAEKWTTDNVLTTQITVEDQVFKFLLLPFQKNETLPELWTAAEGCEYGSEAIMSSHKSD